MFFRILFCLTVFPCFLSGQESNTSSLTIAQIMQGEQFVGYAPAGIRWSDDSKTVYFSWNPDRDTLRSRYKVDWSGRQPEKLSIDEEKRLPQNGIYNSDRSQKVFSRNGDLYLWKSGSTIQLTNTVGSEQPVTFLEDDTAIAFQMDGNLYQLSLSGSALTQLTHFQSGKEKKDPSETGFRKWLEEDQEQFEILTERRLKEEIRKKKRERLAPDRPRTLYTGKDRVSNLRLSPDGNLVTYNLVQSPSSNTTVVPDYVTSTGFTKDLRARAKVGSPQNTYQFYCWNRAMDTLIALDIEQLPGIKQKPAFLEEYHDGDEPWDSEHEEPRPVVVTNPIFSKGGRALLNIRSLDNKDRWICLLDPSTGKLKVVDHQRDEAWIGGPGISSWNFSTGNIGWFEDEKRIWFQSEATGYSHLYVLDVEQGNKRALTQGNFEIIDAELAHDESRFYVTATADSPHEHHFYHLHISDGQMTRITSDKGGHQIFLSPDQDKIAYRFSASNSPWELYLMDNKSGAKGKKVTQSITSEFNAYNWRKPEIISFTAEDGAQVPARLYQPAASDRNGAAVIFVHGAGYLQNVHEWWSSYYREYMFHNLLVDNGYTVLDIDYRASNGYGRDWRTGIYRHMGGKDLSDQIDGAKYLVEELGIDPDRIGIYGGSYGGFITLMALFTSPGTFKAGAALRSVADWAHYNHGYTSNILNTPLEDPKAYRRSSPIYFADQLEDRLLILHGMIDTNVHFQDVVRLAQRLIELGKEDWEFAVFPLEGHGFQESTSWTDEYRRIFELFQEELRQD